MESDILARRFAVADDVVVEGMGDATVVVNLATDQIHELNETAARLLERLGEGKAAAVAADELAAEYEADPEIVRADVERTLRVFLDGALVTALPD